MSRPTVSHLADGSMRDREILVVDCAGRCESNALIAQLAEAADLKSAQCRFESDWGHETYSETPNTGRSSQTDLARIR